jgi:pimeloyl-ACP methyl ester carboxylesterase
MREKCLKCLAVVVGSAFVVSTADARGLEELDQRGEKARVGHRMVEIVLTGSAGERRPIDVHFWYPAEETSWRSSEATIYRSRWDGVPLTGTPWAPYRATITSTSAREAPEIDRRGRYPLVLLSHGSGNDGADYSYVSEAVASYGYVIAAPDHTGNTRDDTVADVVNSLAGKQVLACLDGLPRPCSDATATTLVNRGLDLAAILDALEDGLDATVFHGKIDLDRVGTWGHSRGAQTALIMSSGSASLKMQPDPRILGVATMAPPIASVDQLASLRAPVLLLHGLLDRTVLPSDSQGIFDGAVNASRFRITFPAGHHRTFVQNSCDRMQSAGGLLAADPADLTPKLLMQEFLAVASGTYGSVLDFCRYEDFVEPVDIRGVVQSLAKFAVTPDDVPRTGLAAADMSILASKLLVEFFDATLQSGDVHRFPVFLSPDFLRDHEAIEMTVQIALAGNDLFEGRAP